MNKVRKVFSLFLTVVMLLTCVFSSGVIANATLLELKEERAYLLLIDYPKEDIKNVPVSTVLENLKDKDGNVIHFSENDTVVWAHYKNSDGEVIHDEYHAVSHDSKMDLSYYEGTTDYTMELIVGSGKQLDAGNKRYIVKVFLALDESLIFDIYSEDSNGKRTEVKPIDSKIVKSTFDLGKNPVPMTMYAYTVQEGEYSPVVSMFSPAFECPGIDVKIYDANDLAFAHPINDQILNQDMSDENSGYKIGFGTVGFVVEFFVNGVSKGKNFVFLALVGGYVYVSTDLKDINDTDKSVVAFTEEDVDIDYESADGVYNQTIILKKGLPVDGQYKCFFKAANNDKDMYPHVEKAVLGHYNTVLEAEGQKDIKEDLFVNGYAADYSNGVDFTAFIKNESNEQNVIAYKMTIRTEKYNDSMSDYDDAPIVGSADPWFRVEGVKQNGNTLDTYVVENGKNINMDTLYGYGYQTIFVNDEDADLSKLSPTFYVANDERVKPYVGTEQESGVTTQDFSKGSVLYSTVITDEDGTKHTKNYDVNIVKKASGAKLFVLGPTERSIFLDEYFEEKHDILVANIGDQTLTGIKAELIDAKNVKIDDYWSIGGKNNDTLAPFEKTTSDSQYGELSNLAKVRLIPDGSNGGEISGTLRITADGGQSYDIKLSGRAKNPEIVTDELDSAVKYVPYSYLVATNNMNDWNEVTYTLIGDLPKGLSFDKSTGEIYGVPQTDGTYKIKITANYSRSDYFEPSEKSFTLTVKKNTNENVFNASDEGYEIKKSLGTDENDNHDYVIDSLEDQEFISYGEIDEFVALWLNGQELERDKDYKAEHGSTKITVMGQTFEQKANQNGSNTIAMEFKKTDGDKQELKRTAQNFKVDIPTTDKAVDNVITLIDKIPTSPTLADKDNVEAARNAYNQLNSTQQQAVTNYARLTSAEKRIAVLEAEKKQREQDVAAANKVIVLINALPNKITLDDKAQVVNARSEYNKLTATQKGYVTNLSRLVEAEKAITTLEKDKAEHDKNVAAANKVSALINALPSDVTLADKAKVNEARTAYNKLTSEQKKYVENYEKLVKAENKILELEAEQRKDEAEKAEINAVITEINNIPANVTLDDKATVEKARKSYDKLSASQKKEVVNYDKLVKAEESIAALEKLAEADEADKKAAEEVIAIIDALPNQITLNDKAAVEEARAAYNKLTNKQKKMVSNYAVLENAEKMIETLEAYEESNKKDQEAADAVMQLIDKLPAEITVNDKTAINEARAAYDGLTDAQKKIVTNYDILESAEVALAEAEYREHQNEDVKGYITLICALKDANGNPLKDYIVEIHSEIMTSVTDANGYCRFTNVEIGEHTVVIKDKNNKIVAEQKVTFMTDGETDLDQYIIKAADGETYTLSLTVDTGKASVSDIVNDDKTPEIPTEDPKKEEDKFIEIPEDTKKPEVKIDEKTGEIITNPKTGDNTNLTLWYILMISSGLTGASLFIFERKRKKKSSDQ